MHRLSACRNMDGENTALCVSPAWPATSGPVHPDLTSLDFKSRTGAQTSRAPAAAVGSLHDGAQLPTPTPARHKLSTRKLNTPLHCIALHYDMCIAKSRRRISETDWRSRDQHGAVIPDHPSCDTQGS